MVFGKAIYFVYCCGFLRPSSGFSVDSFGFPRWKILLHANNNNSVFSFLLFVCLFSVHGLLYSWKASVLVDCSSGNGVPFLYCQLLTTPLFWCFSQDYTWVCHSQVSDMQVRAFTGKEPDPETWNGNTCSDSDETDRSLQSSLGSGSICPPGSQDTSFAWKSCDNFIWEDALERDALSSGPAQSPLLSLDP